MTDIFTKEKRSDVMSRIRPKNTKPEILVFRHLRKEGVYFQKHYRRAPAGTPGIALPSKKLAVFIDGDFWHGYRFPQWKDKLPKKYWQDKIQANIDRDRRTFARLRRAGWKVLRVWEHNLKSDKKEKAFEKITRFLIM
ncbi:MAG: very short patch repair endonuclease [Minisyncoccota bacterium]